MTAEQWITLATNGGLGLVSFAFFLFVLMPAAREEQSKNREAMKEAAAAQAAGMDRLVGALERNTASIGTLANQVTRVEMLVDYARRPPAPPAAVPTGSADLPPIAVVR